MDEFSPLVMMLAGTVLGFLTGFITGRLYEVINDKS